MVMQTSRTVKNIILTILCATQINGCAYSSGISQVSANVYSITEFNNKLDGSGGRNSQNLAREKSGKHCSDFGGNLNIIAETVYCESNSSAMFPCDPQPENTNIYTPVYNYKGVDSRSGYKIIFSCVEGGKIPPPRPFDQNSSILSVAESEPPPALTVKASQKAANVPPTIYVSPSMQTSSGTIQILGRVEGGGRISSLTVDGSTAPFSSDGTFNFARSVPIGRSEIRIVASNEWGKSGEATIQVMRTVSNSTQVVFPPLDPGHLKATPRPQAIALIIGIERYENAPSAEFAENDAKSFYDYATNALGVSPDRIKILTGSDARRLDIQKALRSWLRPMVRGQTDVFVFFSGHGLASQDGNDLFLLPYDGDRDLLTESAIRRKDVVNAITDAGAASATLFLDTCYSGGTRGKDSLVTSARPILVAAKEQSVPPNVTILAAAGSDQLSSSMAQTKHGLFSYFLMKGLEGEAAGSDRTITAAKLEAYLADHIPSEAAKLGRVQTPQLVGEGERVLVSW